MSHATTTRHAQNVSNFKELVEFCAAMDPARFHPVRLNLKIKSLQDALIAAQDALAKADVAHAELIKSHHLEANSPVDEKIQLESKLVNDRAVEARNAVLYAPGEGIVDLANDCKTYLKSLKGPKEESLHHITHLDFRAPG